MGALDSMLSQLIEKNSKNIWGIYTQEEKLIIDDWNKKIGEEDATRFTAFREKDFLENFLNKYTKEEGYLYALNTYKYFKGDKSADKKYVIFTRRAIPSREPKPEAFWTSEHSVALNGLRREIPIPQRYYTSIMVTTLEKLEKHGLSGTSAGGSDGEIVINQNKPFSDFLFQYKPKKEIEDLAEYINNGGKAIDEVLQELSESVNERREKQGFYK